MPSLDYRLRLRRSCLSEAIQECGLAADDGTRGRHDFFSAWMVSTLPLPADYIRVAEGFAAGLRDTEYAKNLLEQAEDACF